MTFQNSSGMHKSISAGFLEPEAAKRYKNAECATLPFAKIIIEKSGLAQLGSEVHVFDLACGTGAVIQELYNAVPREKWGQLKVLGGDVSPPMLAYLEARGKDQGWTGLETQIIDGDVRFSQQVTTTRRYDINFSA
jgi:ubiquinone/menaquinone biosynthesis C-methylase UbiE